MNSTTPYQHLQGIADNAYRIVEVSQRGIVIEIMPGEYEARRLFLTFNEARIAGVGV